MERTIAYLTKQMRQFLRRGDAVLICLEDDGDGSLGRCFYEAAKRCEAKPEFIGEDRRWKTLLRRAFSCRAGTVIGSPLVILGLAKLARARATPLYIRNVVTAGYPCADWMIDGIRNGLDCKTWGCFDVLHEAMVAGFSCREGRGVHIHSDEFDIEIRNDRGAPVPAGSMGAVVLRSKRDGAWISTCDWARLQTVPCRCGSDLPLLTDISLGPRSDPELMALMGNINRWTSVLDCRVKHSESGLEIEIVMFPGEKLPKLPTCARLTVRPWDPETDEPFHMQIRKISVPL